MIYLQKRQRKQVNETQRMITWYDILYSLDHLAFERGCRGLFLNAFWGLSQSFNKLYWRSVLFNRNLPSIDKCHSIFVVGYRMPWIDCGWFSLASNRQCVHYSEHICFKIKNMFVIKVTVNFLIDHIQLRPTVSKWYV